MIEILDQLYINGPMDLQQLAKALRRPSDEVQRDLITLAAREFVHWEIDDTFWLAFPGAPSDQGAAA